jgi:hypothetical protein
VVDAEAGGLAEAEARVVLGVPEHKDGVLTSITGGAEGGDDRRTARTLSLVRRQDGNRPE